MLNFIRGFSLAGFSNIQSARFSFILCKPSPKPLIIYWREKCTPAPDKGTPMVWGVNLRNWEVACQVPLRRLQQFQ